MRNMAVRKREVAVYHKKNLTLAVQKYKKVN